MGKLETLKGTLKTMFDMTLQDFHEMDHKLIRIVGSIAMFIILAWFWFNFLRGITPM